MGPVLFARRGVAAAVASLGVVLEAFVLVPWLADRPLEAQPALHDLQHGMLFVGAVLIGLGLRDLAGR